MRHGQLNSENQAGTRDWWGFRDHSVERSVWTEHEIRGGKKVKVKGALGQALKAQKWSRGIALLFL